MTGWRGARRLHGQRPHQKRRHKRGPVAFGARFWCATKASKAQSALPLPVRRALTPVPRHFHGRPSPGDDGRRDGSGPSWGATPLRASSGAIPASRSASTPSSSSCSVSGTG